MVSVDVDDGSNVNVLVGVLVGRSVGVIVLTAVSIAGFLEIKVASGVGVEGVSKATGTVHMQHTETNVREARTNLPAIF